MAMRSTSRQGKVIGARAALVALALSLGACSQSADQLLSGGLSQQSEPQTRVAEPGAPSPSELDKATEHWGKEHAKTPRDGKVAVNYARNLKAMDRKAEAFAVLQSSYMYNAQDREFLSEFGRLALDQGHAALAQQLLERADDPAKPDWRVLSARGAALAQQGKYKESIPFFERARQLAPMQASLMSNLALAYTMDGRADQAEPLLRQATVAETEDPRVRQNLALILRLQGKSEEATRVAMGIDGPVQTAPAAVVSNPQPMPARVAAVRRPAKGTVARAAEPIADNDPEAVIKAAMAAEIAKEQGQSRPIATSSAPRR